MTVRELVRFNRNNFDCIYIYKSDKTRLFKGDLCGLVDSEYLDCKVKAWQCTIEKNNGFNFVLKIVVIKND